MAGLSNLLKAMLLVLALAMLVTYMLPDRYLVERQRVMARTPEQVWPLLAQPRQWHRWSPWHARDPQMQLRYGQPESGVGAQWRWRSERLGGGLVRFDQVQAPTRLAYTVMFDDTGSTASGEFRLEPVAGGTRVTWTLEAKAGSNVLLRWFSLVADYRLAQDVEAGLARLAEAAATSP